MDIHNLSVSHLKRAAEIKEQIERLNKELSAIFGSPASSRSAPKAKRTMSALARKKIAAAQRARWAELRRANSTTPAVRPAAQATKNTMSPATRKKLSAKLKAYWARKKAARK
jgi:truncated hemoglobin YjbI